MARLPKVFKSSASDRTSGGEIPPFLAMDEQEIDYTIAPEISSKSLTTSDIDESLLNRFDELEERMRILEIRYQTLLNLWSQTMPESLKTAARKRRKPRAAQSKKTQSTTAKL
jgi:predicted transcriptional regulator